jgi:hypothetical protein
MNKYIPKVGEAFEWLILGSWNVAGNVVLVTPLEIVWLDDFGLTQFVTISKFIMRPIQTKSDVEREQLVKIIYDYRYCLGGGGDMDIAIEIQQAGFTIPKKVKRSDVRRIIDINSSMKGYEDDALVEEIFNLLGDLVEQDKGGAE